MTPESSLLEREKFKRVKVIFKETHLLCRIRGGGVLDPLCGSFNLNLTQSEGAESQENASIKLGCWQAFRHFLNGRYLPWAGPGFFKKG